MKRIYPSIFDVLHARFVGEHHFLNTFKRLWGTTMVDGVEVMTKHHYTYPNPTENTKQLTNFFRMKDIYEQDTKGISNIYLYLNPKEDKVTDWQPTNIVNHTMAAVNEQALKKVLFTQSAVVGGSTVRKSFKGSLNHFSIIVHPHVFRNNVVEVALSENFWSKPFADKVTEVLSRRSAWYDTNEITGNTKNLIYAYYGITTFLENPQSMNPPSDLDLSGLLYPVGNALDPYKKLTITAIEAVPKTFTILTTDPNTGRMRPKVVYSKGIRISFHIPLRTLNVSSLFVTRITTNYVNAGVNDKKLKHLFSKAIEGTSYKGPSVSMASSFWHNHTTTGGLRSELYLKASFFDDESLSRKEKISYLAGLVDVDYTEKPVELWEAALAIVLVAVVAYFAGPAGMAAATSLGLTGAAAVVVGVAITVTIVSTAISVLALAINSIDPNIASAMNKMNQRMEPLVMVARVIAIVAVLYRAVEVGVATAAEQAAAQGVESATASAVASEVAKNLSKAVIEAFTGISPSNSIMQNTATLTNLAINEKMAHDNRKVTREMKSAQQEIDDWNAAKEGTVTSDILKEYIRTGPRVLETQISEYSLRYDAPYEPWATPYHTGCIQATTVSGAWHT